MPALPDEPRWRRYLRFWRRNVAADVNDELAFHFEQRVAEFMAAGATREAAECRARERFGNERQARDELLSIGKRVNQRRDRMQVLDNVWYDAVFAVRGLRRSHGLAIACIVTIALGVGANGAMFSLADRLFNRPPSGIVRPDELRRLYVRTTWTVGEVAGIRDIFPYPVYTLLDSSLAPRAQVAGYTKPDTVPAVVDNAPMTLHGAYVTTGYMSALGVHPAMGRFFAPDEQVMGAPAYVAVISDRLWHRVFDAAPNVIGKVVEINRQRTTIIGVAARGFDGPDLSATDVWMPFASIPESLNDHDWYTSYFSGTRMRLLVRVAPGTSNEWLESAATTIVRRTVVPEGRGATTNAVRDTGGVMLAGPILESLAPSIKPVPEVAIARRLIGVTIIVLLIACANVASLLLARAMGRRREIAVRIALGVSRARLVSQLLCEGIILAAVAAVAALMVSVWAGNALRALLMPATYWTDSAIDARVVAFIGFIAIATGVLAGLVPAVQASRPELTEALKSGARDGGAGAHRSRLRQLLLVAQVAMTVLLLYGAGLYVHSLMRLRAIDLGFDADRVVYGSAYPLDSTGRYLDWGRFHSPQIGLGLMAAGKRLEGAPAIQAMALSTGGPMEGYSMIGVYFANGERVPSLDKRDPTWNATTSTYLAATGAKMARGRFFTDADRDGAPVLVVNETAAQFYWPRQDALGKCLRVLTAKEPCSVVIGVMRDSHVSDVVEKPVIQLITPFGYDPAGRPRGPNTIIARAKPGQTAVVERLIRGELTRVFGRTAVAYVQSVPALMEPQLRPWHVGLLLFGGFGLLALTVAALGTYSVLSYSVSQRLHEISVRIALGARGADVLRLVVGQGVRLTMIGVALGLLIALAVSRVMQTLLYDTSPREPLVTLGVAALLVAIAAVASALPALRAARVDPVGVLRAE
ncbi:MAG TPA: ADOP family duplicated permease [Gemmatimonadaceae bacterium]|nr:ADOP family duplicated permease [Gemmatimonadaceae bacterium]